MSTILEALKKSEQERKSKHMPTLSDMPVPQETSRWPLYVIAGLSLVLALVLGVLLSTWFNSPNKIVAASNGESQQHTRTENSGTQLTQPVSRSGVDVEASNESAAPLSLAAEVVINVVSYSGVPAQRFVMLNGKMYRENDFVKAGLKVEKIKPNAVVFNARGELVTRVP